MFLVIELSSEVIECDYHLLISFRSVNVLDRATLKCLCTIKVSNKLVNAIRLQPRDSSSASAKSQLVAIGSNENHIQIVDLSKLPSAAVNGGGEETYQH